MKRTFDEHIVRRNLSLNGEWKFMPDESLSGESEQWYKRFPDGSQKIIAPGCWNTELRMLNYTGVCWYEREFYFNTNGAPKADLLLDFQSVMTKATVYFDGEKIGYHDGAFCAFDIIVPDVCEGMHKITVKVDNTQNKKSIPQPRVDWFNYGGIARDVEAGTLEEICVISNHMIYNFESDVDFSRVNVSFELDLYNASSDKVDDEIAIRLNGKAVATAFVTLEGKQRKTVKTDTYTLEIEPWSCESPTLYTLEVKTSTDDLIDRVGFRYIEVRGGEILLNGKKIELRGVNRHDEHPDWGFAFPQGLMRRDIDLICELGCNTVRGSHYPQSRAFVDMLDERGLLFWSEIPIWGCGFSEEVLSDPDVVELGLEMHKEMCYYYYNHPSIIIWGMHNEVYQHPCVYEISKKYHACLRERGGNRLITHAAMFPADDPSCEFDDIICINHYKGWYGGGNGGYLDDWKKMIDDFRVAREERGMADKPVIFSEFGAAALADYHEPFDSVKWSEEYQAELLRHCLTLFHEDPMVKGFYIWQFTNIRTSPLVDLNRARCFNNKGILDEYRRPKASFFTVRELYRKFKSEENE